MFKDYEDWFDLATKTDEQLLDELKEESDLLQHIAKKKKKAKTKYDKWHEKCTDKGRNM